MTTTDLNKALKASESRTQDYLLRRPPPFFVQRVFNLVNVQRDDRLELMQRVFPTVDNPAALTYATLGDAATYTQRDDVACLNRYFHSDAHEDLDRITQEVRALAEEARSSEDDRLLYRFSELLGYVLTEQCYWEFISQPLVALRFDKAAMAEAEHSLGTAFLAARERRDLLYWHRIAANQARLGYLAQVEAATLAQSFDLAISLGQLCLDQGIPVDRAFDSRRDELLHMAGVVKFFGNDLTYPNLTAHIKSPAGIKPPPGMIRVTLESGSLIGNVSTPLLSKMENEIRSSAAHAAFVDLLSLEDRVQVWMTFKGGYRTQSLMYRDLHGLDNLDLLFRPNRFEVMLEAADEPLAGAADPDAEEGRSGGLGTGAFDNAAYFRPGLDAGGVASDVLVGEKWVLRFPTLEVGLDDNGNPYHSEFAQALTGMPWERSLGTLLADLLPDDEDLEHLVVSPDGPLALLPFHLAMLPENHLLADRYKVSYAPSLAFFSPAREEARGTASRLAFILDSRSDLEGPAWELRRLEQLLGADLITVLDGFEGDARDLQGEVEDCDIIHVATHAHMFTDAPSESGIDLGNGRTLTIEAIKSLELKPGCLVFLNTCESHRVAIQSRIQFSSIANAFLAAGAATVIAALWETDDIAAALLADRFYRLFLDNRTGRLESLYEAVNWLRELDLDDLDKQELGALESSLPLQRRRPYDHPADWGLYALYGHW